MLTWQNFKTLKQQTGSIQIAEKTRISWKPLIAFSNGFLNSKDAITNNHKMCFIYQAIYLLSVRKGFCGYQGGLPNYGNFKSAAIKCRSSGTNCTTFKREVGNSNPCYNLSLENKHIVGWGWITSTVCPWYLWGVHSWIHTSPAGTSLHSLMKDNEIHGKAFLDTMRSSFLSTSERCSETWGNCS